MKSLTCLLLLLTLLFIFNSCEQNESNPEPEFQKIFQKTDINEDLTLSNLVRNFSNQENSRTDQAIFDTEFGTLDLTKIVETLTDPYQPGSNYSIKVIPPEGIYENTINYLALVAGDDLYYGYVIQLEPDYENMNGSIVFDNFTGVSRILDLNWNVQAINYFEDGVQIEDTSNGRASEAYTNCDCKYAFKYSHSTNSGGDNGLGTMYFEVDGIVCDCDSGGGSEGSTSGETGSIGEPVGEWGWGEGDSNGDGSSGGGSGEVLGFEGLETCPQGEWNSQGVCCPFGVNSNYACMSEEEARIEELEAVLEQDPFALIDPDCEELSQAWKDLAEHKPNQEVRDRVEQLNEEGYDIEMQYIEDATGAVVNMDYFPVEISQLPNNPETGDTFTGQEFFDYIRENFADICFNDDTSFGPYNETEADRWNSNDYLGSVMRFDIDVQLFGLIPGQQDGSVLCTEQQTQSWIFSTIYTSQDHSHPVSGNREFGLISNPDGTYTFYTQGVDRVAELFDDLVEELPNTASAFEGGEELWSNLQQNLNYFINDPTNGGSSTVGETSIERINNDLLEAVLNGQESISNLGCN